MKKIYTLLLLGMLTALGCTQRADDTSTVPPAPKPEQQGTLSDTSKSSKDKTTGIGTKADTTDNAAAPPGTRNPQQL